MIALNEWLLPGSSFAHLSVGMWGRKPLSIRDLSNGSYAAFDAGKRTGKDRPHCGYDESVSLQCAHYSPQATLRSPRADCRLFGQPRLVIALIVG
ncbi:hypothetical protein [Polymorphobacter megasporae]|uniref:hypothetical protein n=1 Tax=Glacieibacterium megasporae TaxID=2835787 RepID=UPI001C1E792B|nr:hypothetical protein [Polymorphobacter megasporae]UAJ12413.1 hypothetical protein KTC28_21635 [Polymorphobacter megasporae]